MYPVLRNVTRYTARTSQQTKFARQGAPPNKSVMWVSARELELEGAVAQLMTARLDVTRFAPETTIPCFL